MEPEIFIPLGFFAFVYGIVYLSIRKKERMALLQFGKDASVFQSNKSDLLSLKWGMILIAVALGILLGNLLTAVTDMQEEVAYFSMIFILGGISLILSYFIGEKQRKEDGAIEKEKEPEEN